MERKKTVARALALQALYQHDLRGAAFLEGAGEFFRSSAKDPADAEIAERLFRGCIRCRDEIDAHLERVSEHWRMARMATTDRAILRIGAYELLHCPDVPPKVAVNEAIRLAKKFGAADSGTFVNGILDRIMSCGATNRDNGSTRSNGNHEE